MRIQVAHLILMPVLLNLIPFTSIHFTRFLLHIGIPDTITNTRFCYTRYILSSIITVYTIPTSRQAGEELLLEYPLSGRAHMDSLVVRFIYLTKGRKWRRRRVAKFSEKEKIVKYAVYLPNVGYSVYWPNIGYSVTLIIWKLLPNIRPKKCSVEL